MGNGAKYVDPGEKTNWKYLLCRREGSRSIATVLAACSSGGVDGLEVAFLNGKSQQQVVLAVVVSHVSRVLHRAALRQTYDRQKTGNNFDLAFAVGHPTAKDVAQEEAQVLAPVAPLMEVLAPVAPLAQAVLVALPMKNLREEIV
eukprot:gene24169-9756_t